MVAIIGVIFGGPSPEHDISILTGLQAAAALADIGEPVNAIYWTKTGDWTQVPADCEAKDFAQGPPGGSRPLEVVFSQGRANFAVAAALGRRRPLNIDVIVNCCHGGPGEDGRLQGLLDLMGVKYTGPSACSAALGMDKLAFAGLVRTLGIASLPRTLLDFESEPDFPGPYIVKPRFGGSSIGISVVEALNDARDLLDANPHLRAGAVIEPYRKEMVDIYVNVRAHPELQLSMIERPRRDPNTEFLDYRGKYLGGDHLAGANAERPAQLPDALEARLRNDARRLAKALDVRGVARVDFLYDGADDLVLNEINMIPGALGLHLWRESGVEAAQLVGDMISEAEMRQDFMLSAAGADGTALLDAKAIAEKMGLRR